MTQIQKLIFVITLLIVGSNVLTAQNNTGEILYEDKTNIHRNLPPEMEAMKERIPEYRTANKILYFNDKEALYVKQPRDTTQKAKPSEFRGEGRRGRRGRFGRGDNNKYYTDIAEGVSLDSRNLFGKDFLVEGEREKLKWKITGEQKKVGAYLCQKATYQDTSTSVVAWFTPMIPVSIGPDKYSGLPGVILHMDFDDGLRQITATNIDLKDLSEDVIVKPSKGKKISQEEYEKIREEKVKEMEQEYGGRRGRFGRRGPR